MADILHISCDFPDVLVGNKTQAVKRLVDSTPEHAHTVYSLNRVDGLSGIEFLDFAPSRIAVVYRAPPKGLLLKTRLDAVAEAILEDMARRKIKVQLIHAHKLTIDGIIGRKISRKLGVPIIFSIQGDTDLKVMAARPDLVSVFAQHVADAAVLFPFAPWAEREINKRFPQAAAKSRMLPVMTGHDDLSAAAPVHSARLASVFHLDSWKRKNLVGMAKAMKMLATRIDNIQLDVFGGGSPTSFVEASEALKKCGAGSLIRLAGPVANAGLASVLQRYAAFVLPTLRESYGLVHVKSLFAGVPIVLSRNMGIDGLLPEADYLAACDPNSAPSIASAIELLIRNEANAKAKLKAAQDQGVLSPIRNKAIIETYREGLLRALPQSARAPPSNRVEEAA